MARFEAVLLLVSLVAVGSIAAEPARPRGVGPDFAKFYKNPEAFTCISNPSIQLNPSQVNDDYCDCPDGSDEPGTSACSLISPLSPPSPAGGVTKENNASLALPGFYCKNKGHRPGYIPFTAVNDGVCDHDLCCDGSDEWEGVGGVTCEDKCKEIGKEWRKQDELRQKSFAAAIRKRKELVAQAALLRKHLEDKIAVAEGELIAAEGNVKTLERDLAETEKREKGKVVKARKTNVLAGLAKDRVEELRETLIGVRQQRDLGRSKVKELEAILSTFKEEYNPNFNDEGVKRAVRSWEEYAAKKDTPGDGETVAAEERDLDEIAKPDDAEAGINWADWEGEEESDVDALYKLEAYLPFPLRAWINDKLQSFRQMLIDNGILAASSSKSTETPALTAARTALDSANLSLTTKRNTLSADRDDLQKPHGTDDIFRALKGHCVATDSGEYTYELCWMERTTQKPKKGGGDTGMGNFVRLDTVTVDDEVPPDGRGVGSGERVAMRYENGQHCWNGPARSTLVVLGCAEKDEVWKVREEEKCVYRMEVGTPAVCEGNGVGNAKAGVPRDEL
ncbi:MAG: hypothetical protein M1833_003936 [Piccolia ochrophora]|nr:MAG: hypothetical protein M1833_003936 [Piccolia ochrophora]